MNNSFHKKVEGVLGEFANILKKKKLAMKTTIVFKSKGDKIPLLSRLALWVINKQGGSMDLLFIDLKKL